MSEKQYQEAQAQEDMRGSKVAQFFEDHPGQWPICHTCGRTMRPTGTVGDRMEFHCGQTGHACTVLSASDEELAQYKPEL